MKNNSKVVVTFGEVMLRLSTVDYKLFEQANEFNSSFAGSEANVATNLAFWGEDSRYLTVLPDNELGRKFISELLSNRVDVTGVRFREGRFGVMYLQTGASYRGSKVIYDRDYSSFSQTIISNEKFNEYFNNSSWFHFSGISPALSEIAKENCERAVQVAVDCGISVSIDLNYRSALWKYGRKAHEVMPKLVEFSKVVVGNEEDLLLSLGFSSDLIDVEKGQVDYSNYKGIAKKFFTRFTNVEVLAITLRKSISASHNVWSSVLFTPDDYFISEEYNIVPIIDRVGAGDAFASGIIFGLINDLGYQEALDFAAAASCLKHTITGDYCLASIDQIKSLIKGNKSGRIQR